MSISIGTKIKAFDFIGREDSYMIGEVMEIISEIMHCRTISVTRDGKEISNPPAEFSTPLPGVMFMDDMFERIQIVER